MLGGAGEFPAKIFELQNKYRKKEKIFRANNIKKQADHGLMGGSAFDHDLIPLQPPPLSKQYHSLDKGISFFLDTTA